MSDGPEDAQEIASPGRPRTVEVAGALADMVAYNGGKRLTCLA